MKESIEEFIKRLEEQFDDLPKGVLKPSSLFREAFSWNSINALIVIALIQTEYGVAIDAEDLRKSKTVQDLYNIVKERYTG
ncbi:MAG TPA: acyl carrier protein [Bacteroidia bacterium]|nr:acyl carrier protein [Bacteroidia bacterium]HRS59094.1 acyl carrier protein [Bacteroidia bacterium]HRU68454.1 acyl carrier protein [Bacteroidia bacterium]